MAAIWYSGPISAVPTNKPPIGEERVCANFQSDISKPERQVDVYTDRRADRHG